MNRDNLIVASLRSGKGCIIALSYLKSYLQTFEPRDLLSELQELQQGMRLPTILARF